MAVVAMLAAAGGVAAATNTFTGSPPDAVSTSGGGDVPLRTAPAGTPDPAKAISALTTSPVATDGHAHRLLETLADEHFDGVRLLRSTKQGDVYAAYGHGRICLAARQPDNGGGIGCTPSDVAQSPDTPLIVATQAGGQQRVVALVLDDVVSGTITTSGGATRIGATNNVVDGLVDGTPQTITLKRRDGTTAVIDLRDQDHNELP